MRGAHVREIVAIENDLFGGPWTEGMFRQEIRDGFLSRPLVGLVDGAVVGYVVAWFLREEVHLLNIAVARAHQGRGYARRMLERLVELARDGNRSSISLEVRVSNARAIRLYESIGFVAAGRRREYYQNDREDALIMVMDIGGANSGGES
jgi:ribosomal-protein-alanine N-acetyltransferase